MPARRGDARSRGYKEGIGQKSRPDVARIAPTHTSTLGETRRDMGDGTGSMLGRCACCQVGAEDGRDSWFAAFVADDDVKRPSPFTSPKAIGCVSAAAGEVLIGKAPFPSPINSWLARRLPTTTSKRPSPFTSPKAIARVYRLPPGRS